MFQFARRPALARGTGYSVGFIRLRAPAKNRVDGFVSDPPAVANFDARDPTFAEHAIKGRPTDAKNLLGLADRISASPLLLLTRVRH